MLVGALVVAFALVEAREPVVRVQPSVIVAGKQPQHALEVSARGLVGAGMRVEQRDVQCPSGSSQSLSSAAWNEAVAPSTMPCSRNSVPRLVSAPKCLGSASSTAL